MSLISDSNKIYKFGKLRVGQHKRAKTHPSAEGFENISIISTGPSWSRELSPLILGPVNDPKTGLISKNVENFWQFLKVYEDIPKTTFKKINKIWTCAAQKHAKVSNIEEWEILPQWEEWRDAGFKMDLGIRFPAGTGNKRIKMGLRRNPLFSYYNNERLGYIDARKAIYVPTYMRLSKLTKAYKYIFNLWKNGKNIMFIDFDGPQIEQYPNGIEINSKITEEKLNDPSRPLGHAYVLCMALIEDMNTYNTNNNILSNWENDTIIEMPVESKNEIPIELKIKSKQIKCKATTNKGDFCKNSAKEIYYGYCGVHKNK
jgi:hypothetical protein